MDNIGDRIKFLRKTLGINQVEFGDKIGLQNSGVSKIELGINNPAERTIKLICHEYNVNRLWLETGEGEMFIPHGDDDEIIDSLLVGKDKDSRIAAALIKGIVKAPGGWEMLAAAVRSMYHELEKIDEEDK